MPVQRGRAARMTLDPIHQFEIKNLFKIGQIGNHAIYFTNSSAYMLLSVAVICFLTIRAMLPPTRWWLLRPPGCVHPIRSASRSRQIFLRRRREIHRVTSSR